MHFFDVSYKAKQTLKFCSKYPRVLLACVGLEQKARTKQGSISALFFHDLEQLGISLHAECSQTLSKLGKKPKHYNKVLLHWLQSPHGAQYNTFIC